MSRRDTILVAVLINAGLLALLFMIAINPSEESSFEMPNMGVEYGDSRKIEVQSL